MAGCPCWDPAQPREGPATADHHTLLDLDFRSTARPPATRPSLQTTTSDGRPRSPTPPYPPTKHGRGRRPPSPSCGRPTGGAGPRAQLEHCHGATGCDGGFFPMSRAYSGSGPTGTRGNPQLALDHRSLGPADWPRAKCDCRMRYPGPVSGALRAPRHLDGHLAGPYRGRGRLELLPSNDEKGTAEGPR